MAYLELNGVAINVGEGASTNLETAGASATSIGGGHYQDVRYTKRSWSFKTTLYTEMEALAYGGLIRGEGQLFTYDDVTTSTKNVKATSEPGLGSSYSTTVPTGFSGKSRIFGANATNDFDVGIIKPQQDLTFNVWTNSSATDPSGYWDYLITVYGANWYQNSFRLIRKTDGDLYFAVSAPDSSGSSTKTSEITVTDPFDGNWKMITAVLRRNAESDEYNQYVYVNGVLSAYATTSHVPLPSDWARIAFFLTGNTTGWPDRVEDMQFLPYAAPGAMVLGWYNFGQEMGALPNLKMTGDVTHDSLVTVRGKVDSVEYIHAGGRTRQRLSFTLTEV